MPTSQAERVELAYRAICLAVNAVRADGSRAHLRDGGLPDWAARLLTGRKEWLLISALVSQRLVPVAAPWFPHPPATEIANQRQLVVARTLVGWG